MEKLLTTLFKSIGAGIAIAIGTIIYLSLGGWIGVIFFSIGLYLVLWFNFNLYTGKVGYINSYKDIPNLLLIFIGNIIGSLIILFLFPNPVAIEIITIKLSAPLWQVFIKAIICGILIYAGVDQYKKGKEYAPIIAVPSFIMAGAEHCIADICFAFASGIINLELIVFILIVTVGNAIGSLFIRFLT